MGNDSPFPPDVGIVIAKLRGDASLSQRQLSQAANIDQSRISRIEKGEIAPVDEIRRMLVELQKCGVTEAKRYTEFVRMDWKVLVRPNFANPQLDSLVLAEQTLGRIHDFLVQGHPWPLVRQVERQANAIHDAAGYLQNLEHRIAFMGDIGVGKSTAICFLFGLLTPEAPGTPGLLERVVLEAGGGRVTLCEVHVRRGPGFGVYVQPQTESELRAIVSDFCAGIWVRTKDVGAVEDADQAVQVSEELARAIRNMAGLVIKRERGADGRRTSRDTARELAGICGSEEEFRTRVIEKMQLDRRTRHEIWYNAASGVPPMLWMAETFKAINNGRMEDVPFPRRLDLVVPEIAGEASPLDVGVIDTKGVDDLAIRADLDAQLKDPRTLVVLCNKFNDAPGATARTLLEHMRKDLGNRVEDARAAILVLPQGDEARKVKDDAGTAAEDDEEGYELKREQISRALGTEASLSNTPVLFFNATKDEPAAVRRHLLKQVNEIRATQAVRVTDLAATVDDLIANHEQQAVTFAVEEVAKTLRHFLTANRRLRTRERQAHQEVIDQLEKVRYASTVWAATRRNGDWMGFDACHHLGVGAGKDALARSRDWFKKLEGQLETLQADPDLRLANRLVAQIEQSAAGWRKAFADAARTAGAEVYRERLQQDHRLWADCTSEWGRGPGFRDRVIERLGNWFEAQDDLKDNLNRTMSALWAENVIQPLEQLCEEEVGQGGEDDA